MGARVLINGTRYKAGETVRVRAAGSDFAA
jgi:hypothetical protein